uniref:Integral membrane protein n=1 Tax=Tolypocladium ophioglossoides (strain CBS 100239) TaxID=1163406 RepID=A0A0L0MZ85_TOLOC
MYSNPQPPRSRADADAWPGPQQQQQERAASRRSSLAANTATPLAERPGDDYFEPLGQAPSQRSRLSTLSVNRLPSLTILESRAVRPEQTRRTSIRIRRSSIGSNRGAIAGAAEGLVSSHGGNDDAWYQGGRPRSVSQPGAAHLPAEYVSFARNSRWLPQVALPRLTEEGARPTMGELGPTSSPISPTVSLPERTVGEGANPALGKPNRLGRASRMFWLGFGRRDPAQTGATAAASRQNDEYDEELTLSTLTNVQNSLFIPDLGGWINRRPTYVLSQRDLQPIRPASTDVQARPPGPQQDQEDETEPSAEESEPTRPGIQRSNTITSRLTDSHYAALPHGRSLEGWSAADKWELDDHVRHMLHSRRSRFKRTMKGFGQYVRRPLGFFVTLYATLITLFGLAWVLFLIGWIYVGEEQVYAIHIIDSVLVALFAVMGDGLAPFRAIDTYHMFFVVRYTRMIEKAGKRPRTRLRKRSIPSEVKESIDGPAPAPCGQMEALQRGRCSVLDKPTTPTNDDRPHVSADADLEDG